MRPPSGNGRERSMCCRCVPSRTVIAASDIFEQRKEKSPEREREKRDEELLEMRF